MDLAPAPMPVSANGVMGLPPQQTGVSGIVSSGQVDQPTVLSSDAVSGFMPQVGITIPEGPEQMTVKKPKQPKQPMGAYGDVSSGQVGTIYGTKQGAEPILAVGGPAVEVAPRKQETFSSAMRKKQALSAMRKKVPLPPLPPLLLLSDSDSNEILLKLSELDRKLYDLNNKCKKNSENLQVGGRKIVQLSRAEKEAKAAADSAIATAGLAASKSLSNTEIAARVIEKGIKIKGGIIIKINSCNTSIDSILENEAVCPARNNGNSESTNQEGGGKRHSANTRRHPRNKPYRFPRRFSRSHCMKKSCKKMGFTERASCRPYKNCYTRKR